MKSKQSKSRDNPGKYTVEHWVSWRIFGLSKHKRTKEGNHNAIIDYFVDIFLLVNWCYDRRLCVRLLSE